MYRLTETNSFAQPKYSCDSECDGIFAFVLCEFSLILSEIWLDEISRVHCPSTRGIYVTRWQNTRRNIDRCPDIVYAAATYRPLPLTIIRVSVTFRKLQFSSNLLNARQPAVVVVVVVRSNGRRAVRIYIRSRTTGEPDPRSLAVSQKALYTVRKDLLPHPRAPDKCIDIASEILIWDNVARARVRFN